ncbi:MAG: hypothetical protein ACM3QU_12800 [Verrucomicrobiota bacterium]
MDFDDAIREHLELRRRNARLEPELPLQRYHAQLTNTDHGPFNRQAEALSEETQELSPGRPVSPEPGRDIDSSQLWDIPPLFDWGE